MRRRKAFKLTWIDHIDDSRETAPGCNVQGCFAALFTLLDVGAGGK